MYIVQKVEMNKNITVKSYLNTECRRTLPTSLKDGIVKVNKNPRSTKNVLGKNITYTCKKPYVLNVEISNYFCRENGTWNNDVNPMCLRSNLNIIFINSI